MLAKPVIPALILSPSLSIFFFYNNQFKLNKSDSLVACLSFLSMASNLDITGEEKWGEKGEMGEEKGAWRVSLFPLSIETKAAIFL